MQFRSLPETAGPELYVSVLLRVDRLRLEALNMFIILINAWRPFAEFSIFFDFEKDCLIFSLLAVR